MRAGMDNEMPEYYAAYFYGNFSYIEWNSGDSFMFMYSTDRKKWTCHHSL